MVVVQHLSDLSTEAKARSSVNSWILGVRSTYVLFVDMSLPHAIDQTNFIRMHVDQEASKGSEKIFIILLHYPPSSALQSSCAYPALFLGGWDHVFLDGIGTSEQAIRVDEMFRGACLGSDASRFFLSAAQAQMHRVQPHVASQRIFHAHQETGNDSSFQNRIRRIDRIFNCIVGEFSVSEILCKKFAKSWENEGLLKTTRRASDGLLKGTTQLSISLSIQSVMVETLTTYITSALKEMNQWFGLDLLLGEQQDAELLSLFGLILESLPMAPFEELLLYKAQDETFRLPPFIPTHHPPPVRFPFFFCVSSLLDQVVENAESTLIQNEVCEVESVPQSNLSDRILMTGAVGNLGEREDESAMPFSRMPAKVVNFIANAPEASSCAIFDCYLDQFLEWKVGCTNHLLIKDWIKSKIARLSPRWKRHLLAVHVVTRLNQDEFTRVIAAVDFVTKSTMNLDPNQGLMHAIDSATFGADICRSMLDNLADRWPEQANEQWRHDFRTFLNQVGTLLSGLQAAHDDIHSKLRSITFLYVLQCCGSPEQVKRDAYQLWFQTSDQTHLPLLEDFIHIVQPVALGELTREVKQAFLLMFSLSWRRIASHLAFEDFTVLLKSLCSGQLNQGHHSFGVALLEHACANYPGASSPRCAHLSADALAILDRELRHTQSEEYTGSGVRQCMPHFIPHWLQGDAIAELAVDDGLDPLSVYCRRHHTCVEGHLAPVVFEMILSCLLSEAEGMSSETLFLLLTEDIETEACLEKLSDQPVDPLTGGVIAAMFIDARLVVFIVVLACEVASGSAPRLFSGHLRDQSRKLLERVMSLRSMRLQDLFFSTVFRMHGEGSAITQLSEGGILSDVSWCKKWANGMPRMNEEARSALLTAENELAAAVQEENRKVEQMRLCPFLPPTFHG